jgi:hypothetical protein
LSESLEPLLLKGIHNHCTFLIEYLQSAINNLRNEAMLVSELIQGLIQALYHVGLALFVHLISIIEEFLQNLDFVLVPADFVVTVEKNEVRTTHTGSEFEFFYNFGIGIFLEVWHSQLEMHCVIFVELSNISDFIVLG